MLRLFEHARLTNNIFAIVIIQSLHFKYTLLRVCAESSIWNLSSTLALLRNVDMNIRVLL